MKCSYYFMTDEEKRKAAFNGTVASRMKRFKKLAEIYGEKEAYRKLTGKNPDEVPAAENNLEEKMEELQKQVDEQKAQMEEFAKLQENAKQKEE